MMLMLLMRDGKADANRCIEQIREVVNSWMTFAQEAELSETYAKKRRSR